MISLRPHHYRFKKSPAFYVHEVCWAIFSKNVDHAPLSQWHRMIASAHRARTRRGGGNAPDLSETLLCEPEVLDQGYKVFLCKKNLFSEKHILTDEYSEILFSIKTLSTELRLRIWRFLDEGWTRRVLSALSRIPEIVYMHNIHAHGPSSFIQLGELKIYSYNCERMGISYLNCVHVESVRTSTSAACSGDVEVPAQVSTIETINGYFGVSAVRFYTGQEKTPWLGKPDPRPQHRWYRFVKNKENSRTIHIRRLQYSV